jgi:hypothetical protein
MKQYTFGFLRNLQSLSTWMSLCWIKRYVMMYGEVEVYYHVLLNLCMKWIYVVSIALRPLYPPGERSQPLNMRPSGPRSRFERFSEEKHSFHLGGIEPRYLGPSARVLIIAEWTIQASPYSRNHRKILIPHVIKSSKKPQDVIGEQVTIFFLFPHAEAW